MKKFAMLLAAGVIALGASAQAAPVESVTYAVITVPIASGYNFIGVSVAPIDGTADTFADILGVPGDTEVSEYTGDTYEATTADKVTANLGCAVLYSNDVAKTIYEVGVAQTVTTSVDLVGTYTLVASPFADAWSPSDTSLDEGSYSRWGAKANKIHVWNGTGWETWWYKAGKNGAAGEWKCKDTTITDEPPIGAAQAVLIEKGSANSATSVTFE